MAGFDRNQVADISRNARPTSSESAVEQEEADVENPLHRYHDETFKYVRFRDMYEGHQMHALVLGFLKQRADPAIVVAHVPKALQMRQRRADHAGHSRHRFEHDGAMAVPALKECVRKKPQELRKTVGEAIREASWLVVHSEVDDRDIHGYWHPLTSPPP
jgi:hypothetical protein